MYPRSMGVEEAATAACWEMVLPAARITYHVPKGFLISAWTTPNNDATLREPAIDT